MSGPNRADEPSSSNGHDQAADTGARGRPRRGGSGAWLVAIVGCVTCLALVMHLATRRDDTPGLDLSCYLYNDTRRLVSFVEDAAERLAEQGPACLAEFEAPGSGWFSEDQYLFVYDLEGRCVFHPMLPSLVGADLIDFRDLYGRPVIRMITDIGREPGARANGWVFYLWESGMQILPEGKGSYIRKVVAPDGQVYVIGSGRHDLKMEKVFVQERVERAARLVEQEGESAFATLRDPASPFHFLGAWVFVLDMNGQALVDPSYPMLRKRELIDFRDLSGTLVIREMIAMLARRDSGWLQYRWHRPGASMPSRKLMYFRKVRVGSEWLIVGSDFFLATPVWMRS